jgi:hypothetical protein
VSAVRWAGRHWRLLGVLLAAVVVWVWLGTWFAAGLLVVCGLLARRTRARGATPAKRPRWWTPDHLSGAMVAAGILRPTPPNKKGQPTVPKLFYRGKPVHTDHGTTAIVGLPQATTLGDVRAKRTKLAAAMQIPENRLHLRQATDDPANVIRITVDTARVKAKIRPAAVADATQTDWSQPIVIGVDDRGRDVTFTTTETHSGVFGATGSGKTVLAHLVLTHAALDPRVRIYGIDGKGDAGAKGWQPLEPRCEAFVRGMGPDSPARIEAMLTEVHTLAEERGAAENEAPEVVLILEEWAAARTVLRRLDRDAAERCDALVTVLLATARSRGVHILLIAQRGTATSFPVDQRANCGQRIVGKFGDRAEAGYVLESLPARLPERAGEFALSLDGRPAELVTVDYLDNGAWVKVCQRAERLRAPSQMDADTRESPALSAVPSRQPAVEPLIEAVVAVLANADPRGISASQLHAALPEWVQETYTSTSLGMALARHSKIVERAHLGSARVWRLTSAGRSDAAGVV